MDKDCVDYSSALPALDADKLRDCDFVENEEDEITYNLMNDDTFGDLIEGEDWEAQHELLTGQLSDGIVINGMHEHKYGSCGDSDYRKQEEELEHSIRKLVVDDDDDDDYLEERLHYLGDPGIISASKATPIPKRVQNLDELFSAASPPAIMDTQTLVSPTRRSIWGSPGHEHGNHGSSSLHFAFENMGSRSPIPEDPSIIRVGQPSPPMHKPMTLAELEQQMLGHRPSLHKSVIMTAEELEKTLLENSPHAALQRLGFGRGRTPPISVPSMHAQIHHDTGHATKPFHSAPGSAPLFDHHGSPSQPTMTSTNSIHHPGYRHASPSLGISHQHHHHQPPHNNRVSPLLNREMNRTPSPVPTSPSPTMQHQQIPGIDPSLANLISQGRGMPAFGRGIAQMAGRMMNNGARPQATPGRGSIISQQQHTPHVPHQQPPPSHQQYHMNTSPYGTPIDQGRVPESRSYTDPGPYQQNHSRGSFQNNYQQSQNFNFRQQPGPGQNEGYASQNRNPGSYQNKYQNYNRPPGPGQPHNMPRNYQQYSHNIGPGGDRDSPGDEYAGLMTQKEKDWIIKIQLIQLQTDNPYVDDYYYTYFMMNKKARERQEREKREGKQNGDTEVKLILPSLAKFEFRTYKPVQFDNSLGRLTTSSCHNPRQIIDVKTRRDSESNADDGDSGQSQNISKELRRFRQLLIDIEMSYNLLLDVDDIEKKVIVLPAEARLPLFEERKSKIELMYSRLTGQEESSLPDTLLSILSIRKGKKLTARMLPLFTRVQAETVVAYILKHLQILIKKDQADEALLVLNQPLCHVIGNCNFDGLVHISSDLMAGESNQNPGQLLELALQHKFGSTIIASLLSRGEIVYTETSPVDMDNQMQNKWTQFVQDTADAIYTADTNAIARAHRPHENVFKHFERILHRKLLGAIEDKIGPLTTVKTEDL